MSKRLFKNDCNIEVLKGIAQLALDKAVDEYMAGVMSDTPFNRLYCALDEVQAEYKADMRKAKRSTKKKTKRK